MGYHRDGEILGLTPFETEMRRRIWWHILKQDAKLSDAAAATASILPSTFDTKPPCNINDADMHPATSELLRWKAGPTEMSFVLLFNEVYMCRQTADAAFDDSALEMANTQGSVRMDSKSPEEELVKLNLEDAKESVRELGNKLVGMELLYVDASAGGVHGAARCIRPLLTNKWVDFLESLGSAKEPDANLSCISVLLYKHLVASFEGQLDARDSMSALGFGWYMNVRFEIDLVKAMIVKTCHEPASLLAERVWSGLERLYDQNPGLFDLSKRQHYVLADYIQQAWLLRAEAYMERGYMTQLPSFILRIQNIRRLEAQFTVL